MYCDVSCGLWLHCLFDCCIVCFLHTTYKLSWVTLEENLIKLSKFKSRLEISRARWSAIILSINLASVDSSLKIIYWSLLSKERGEMVWNGYHSFDVVMFVCKKWSKANCSTGAIIQTVRFCWLVPINDTGEWKRARGKWKRLQNICISYF